MGQLRTFTNYRDALRKHGTLARVDKVYSNVNGFHVVFSEGWGYSDGVTGGDSLHYHVERFKVEREVDVEIVYLDVAELPQQYKVSISTEMGNIICRTLREVREILRVWDVYESTIDDIILDVTGRVRKNVDNDMYFREWLWLEYQHSRYYEHINRGLTVAEASDAAKWDKERHIQEGRNPQYWPLVAE